MLDVTKPTKAPLFIDHPQWESKNDFYPVGILWFWSAEVKVQAIPSGLR